MKRHVMLCGFLIIALMVSLAASAAIPRLITLQGRLTDASGNPVADGSYQVTFTIYTDSLAGVQLWSEIQTVSTQQGLFNVQLGQVNALVDSIFSSGPNLFVGLLPAGAPAEMSPRIRLTSSAFAFRALHADTATVALGGGGGAGGWVDDGTIVRLETITDHVGVGVTTTKSKLEVDGDVSAGYYRIRDTVVLKEIGRRSLCVGSFAGASTKAEGGTFVGNDAGRSGSGAINTFVGFQAGYNTDGDSNVFVGHSAGYTNVTGQGNVYIGSDAGYAAIGSGNVFIGDGAGYSVTGNQKLYLGSGTTPLIYGDFASTKIGLGTTTPATKLEISDVVRITGGSMWPSAGEGLEFGYNATLNKAFITARDRTAGTYSDLTFGYGNVGIGTYVPSSKLTVSGEDGSVDLLIKADIDNLNESMQPSLTLSQDGGAVIGQLGYFDASNTLTLMQRYAGPLELGTADSVALTITSASNVGIGTTNPFSHRLKVWSDGTGSGASTLLAQNGYSGMGGVGLHAVSNGIAVLADGNTSTGVGIEAYGGSSAYAAKFHGNVALYSLGDGHLIMELGEGLDYAEGFDTSPEAVVEPGMVLVIDPDHPGHLEVSRDPYDTKVAGIAAGGGGLGSGVRLGGENFDVDVALAGRVYCNVDATQEGIEPGDLLTTSATPGFAMKVSDHAKANGAILGKAMESLEKGKKGQILVLVTLQ